MSKEKISTQKQYDIRTRLQAMQGKPLPAATVHKGMRDLEQKLERQRETQQTSASVHCGGALLNQPHF
jgi:hypothetical protein